MSDDTAGFLAALAAVVVFGFMAIGWAFNIIALFDNADGPVIPTLLRVIGIFLAPLGAVLGWFA